ncbi:alanine racemase [Thermoleophilia bacterium SCSIO 60948]|nr:alanine racemase [Thermoleophilia bacterium SCSIO 60948]
MRAEAVIDLDALETNARELDRRSGEAALCCVVKADGYGHGVPEAASAALAGGARMLAVATANEVVELRRAQPDAAILVMGALSDPELDLALGAGAEIAVWRRGFLDRLVARSAALGAHPRLHVKADTGMGRLGNKDPREVVRLCEACSDEQRVELAGLWTHFATADEPGSEHFAVQLAEFTALADELAPRHPGLIRHAANSAATLIEPRSHFDMVRCGVALYGLDPFGSDPRDWGLEPALRWRSYVADVKRFRAGEGAGYGQTWRAERDTLVGVVPIGYADGVRRALSNRGELLVGGRRVPIAGTISMDNLTVDLGPDSDVEPGAEAVLIGAQGDDELLAEEMARTLDTINYEITCGVSRRVPRSAEADAMGTGPEEI